MSLIEWKDKYSIEIDEIDNQHKKLISIINDLYNEAERRAEVYNLEEILDRLTDYTIYHFSQEEKILKSIENFSPDEHISEHENFIIKIKNFREKFKRGEETITYDLLFFLKDWLLDHIMVKDKALKDLKEKGLLNLDKV